MIETKIEWFILKIFVSLCDKQMTWHKKQWFDEAIHAFKEHKITNSHTPKQTQVDKH